MKAQFTFGKTSWETDLSKGVDISIPVRGDSRGVRCWGVGFPRIEPHRDGSFTGSVEAGAPVNFKDVSFNPHAHGTHTECLGHITAKTESVLEHPPAAWVVAACDMPRVSAKAVRWLIGRRRLGGYAVLPCVREGCVEPLLAVYEPPVLPVLEELVAAGTWGLRRLAGIGGVDCPIPPPDLWAAWESVNTLEQFHARSDLDVS